MVVVGGGGGGGGPAESFSKLKWAAIRAIFMYHQ